jgi:hypothetical protein
VDAFGNTSASRSQTIMVVDTTAPAIGAPGADTTIACDETPVFTPPTASDACGAATVQQVSDNTTTQGTNTIYTRCWNAVDACNNTSGTVCQTITRPACESHCTVTQGFFGNSGGIFTGNGDNCYGGLGTLPLIKALLGDTTVRDCGQPSPNPLIVGVTGVRSLIIPLSAAQCIIDRLPANGSADTLPNWSAPVDKILQNSPTCQVVANKTLPLKNGRFNNVLLGQTITLALNLRIDPTLGNLDLTTIGTPIKIRGAWYRQFCTRSGTTITSYLIAQNVINALPSGTVSDLLALANRALAGQSLPQGVSLSDINSAVDAINTGFDQCRMLVPCPLQPQRPATRPRRF